MKINEVYLTKHPNYTQKKTFTPKQLMLHSIGCATASASGFVKNWNNPSIKKGVHAFIDANTGEVFQILPWRYKAWHCGGSGNSTAIGVEMCESNYIKYTTGAKFKILDKAKAKTHAETTYNTAVELFAYLCKVYNLNPLKDIVSHNEGHKKGIASGHVDPEHYWNGLKELGLNYTMDGFRRDVDKMMHPDVKPTPSEFPYKIRVTVNNLNVRKDAGASNELVMKIHKGEKYTIVAEKTIGASKWGKLKSGAGWISLKYTERA